MMCRLCVFVLFKQKTAYELRISDWSSDVCSSDLLLVLGPERLPKAARFAGLWVRRGRAQWASVRSELERELAADELKRSLRETEDAMRDIDASVREADAPARRELDALRRPTKALAADRKIGV